MLKLYYKVYYSFILILISDVYTGNELFNIDTQDDECCQYPPPRRTKSCDQFNDQFTDSFSKFDNNVLIMCKDSVVQISEKSKSHIVESTIMMTASVVGISVIRVRFTVFILQASALMCSRMTGNIENIFIIQSSISIRSMTMIQSRYFKSTHSAVSAGNMTLLNNASVWLHDAALTIGQKLTVGSHGRFQIKHGEFLAHSKFSIFIWHNAHFTVRQSTMKVAHHTVYCCFVYLNVSVVGDIDGLFKSVVSEQPIGGIYCPKNQTVIKMWTKAFNQHKLVPDINLSDQASGQDYDLEFEPS